MRVPLTSSSVDWLVRAISFENILSADCLVNPFALTFWWIEVSIRQSVLVTALLLVGVGFMAPHLALHCLVVVTVHLNPSKRIDSSSLRHGRAALSFSYVLERNERLFRGVAEPTFSSKSFIALLRIVFRVELEAVSTVPASCFRVGDVKWIALEVRPPLAVNLYVHL